MADNGLESLFMRAAQRAIRFRQGVDGAPHAPGLSYQRARKLFDEPVPETPSEPGAVIDDLADRAEQALMKAVGPRFFGWVIGSSHPVGVAADWLTSAWGQNAGNHHISPSASAAEAVASRWLLELLSLPMESSIGFATGATLANFTCLAAARGAVLRRAGWDVDANGLFGAPPISVLIGDDAHTTIFSALQYLGLGHDRVLRVATDAQGTVSGPAFADSIRDVSGPIIAILQAGQINTGGFDAFAEIIPPAKAKGAWVHVDGAFGLWARSAPSLRHLTAGIELADSWATDGHKWLQTPYDCGYAIVRDETAHRRAMTISASYLPTAADGDRDPSQYVPELSRRARGFATWAIVKTLGRSGIVEMIERHCRIARLMAAMLAAEPGVLVVNDVVLNQVIVRFGADLDETKGDDMTARTIARIQKDGTCFASGAKWRGRQVMRISVIGGGTTEAEAVKSAEAMLQAYLAVRG